MKLYHYALFFAVLCIGFFMTAHVALVLKMQEESNKKTEYDCLVAAVDAMVEVVFEGDKHHVTKADLVQAEDAFFRTLEVLWYGTSDCTTWEELRKRIPCIVVFAGDGYHRYCFEKEYGYGWSEFVPYDHGEIPASFFDETEELLTEYHDIRYNSSHRYRIEHAEMGIWEKEISPMCVIAIYAPVHSELSRDGNGFLYAASEYRQTAYYVTEDNRYHLPSCAEYKERTVIGCYSTQKESAAAGAMPCERCMR